MKAQAKHQLQQSQTRQRFILFIKLVVAAGLIYWLIASGQLNLVQLTTIGERWYWFVLAQIPFGLVQWLSAWRWRLLMRIQGIEYTVRDTFNLTLIGIFFNQAMIGSTGGDIYRAYAVWAEHPEKRSGGVISVFADRAIGLVALLALVPMALLWNLELAYSSVTLWSLSAIVIITLLLIVIGTVLLFSVSLRRTAIVRWIASRIPFRHVMKRINEAVMVHRFHTNAMILIFGVSIVIQLLVVACNVFLAYALLGTSIGWEPFLLLIPIAHLGMAVPINPPGAIGTGEAIYAHLLRFAGIAEGGLICVLQRVTFLLWSIPGAFLYITRRQLHGNQVSNCSPEAS